jgi:hypothetical protein
MHRLRIFERGSKDPTLVFDSRTLVPNINLFMNIPIDANGELQIKAPLSRPGDHVDLAAEAAPADCCRGPRVGSGTAARR